MPTYAYACTSCDHRFEVRQSFTDSALSECPECTGSVRKLFNTVGIVFKGSGFYATDSRSSGNGSSTGASPAGTSSAETTSSSSSGTKGSNDTKASNGSAKASTGTTATTSSGTGSAA